MDAYSLGRWSSIADDRAIELRGAGPPLLLAQILIWTYVASRAAHFIAYMTAQIHDIRAFCWTWSSLAVIAMAGYTLMKVF
jgi:glutathione S-transferase